MKHVFKVMIACASLKAGAISKCHSVNVLQEFFLLKDCRQQCSANFSDSLYIYKRNMLSLLRVSVQD